MAAPPEAVRQRGTCVSGNHPKMRIQFWLTDPFDPIETMSVTFLDDLNNEIESVVLAGTHSQYELWELIATVAASFMSTYGLQQTLDVT